VFGGVLVVVAAPKGSLAEMRALAHPLRLRMLSLLTGGPSSAAVVSRELGVSQANASYHLRQLLAAGLIVDAGEVAVRGGRARMYRHDPESTASPDTGQARPAAGGRAAVIDAIAEELRRRDGLADATVPGTLTDAELWVDPEVWAHTVTAVRDASTALHAAARPPRTAGTIAVNMTAVLFAMGTTRSDSPPRSPSRSRSSTCTAPGPTSGSSWGPAPPATSCCSSSVALSPTGSRATWSSSVPVSPPGSPRPRSPRSCSPAPTP